MSVDTTDTYSGPYSTNGVTTEFPFGFKALAESEVAVAIDGVTASPDLYDVSLVTAGGGTVTFATAPADGSTLYVLSDPDFTQSIEFENGSRWLAGPVNEANDRSAIRDLYLRARALLFTPSGIDIPSNRIGKFLGWGGSGEPAFLSGTGADAALRTDLATSTGGSLVGWLRSATGAVARSVADWFTDSVQFMDFAPSSIVERAAIRAGTSNNDHTACVQAAADTGRKIRFPAGRVNFTTVNITLPGTKFVGEGEGTILRQTSSQTQHGLVVTADGFVMEDLRYEGTATDATNSTFGVWTNGVDTAKRMRIRRVVVSSPSAGLGFVNFVKADTGCDGARFRDNYIERLWGTASGRGYAFLFGGVNDARVTDNSGKGTAGRGRHFCYFSAGTSYSRCTGNHVEGFNYEAYTIYATDLQPVCKGNVIADNTAIECGNASVNGGSISAFTNVQNAKIARNSIFSSAGCGIKVDGTGSVNMKNVDLVDNVVDGAGFAGIDIIALQGGSLVGNDVRNSSQTSLGIYWNIRLKSDGTTASSNILISGNRCGGAQARSSLYIDNTAPAPSNLKITGNKFDTCNLTDTELNSLPIPIDGYLRASVTWDIGSLADGASELKTGISVPGAVVGDRAVLGHTSLVAAGWRLDGIVTAADTVGAIVENKTGGTLNPPTGTLYIEVFKRVP